MIKYFINYLFKTKTHILILLYLFIGTLFFIVYIPTDDYLYIIGNLFSQKTYLCMFLFPSFLLFGLYQYRLVNNNSQLIIRLKNRIYYLFIQSLITFLAMLLFLFEVLLIASSIAVIFHGFNIDSSGIELFIYQLIRLYSCVIILQFIVTTLLMIFKKSSVAIFSIFLLIFISFQNVPSTINTIWNTILLTRYIFYYPVEITKLNWFGISSLYYIVVFIICFTVQYFYVRKIDFMEEK